METVFDILIKMKSPMDPDGPFVTIQNGNTTFQGTCGYFINNWSDEMHNMTPLSVDINNHIIITK